MNVYTGPTETNTTIPVFLGLCEYLKARLVKLRACRTRSRTDPNYLLRLEPRPEPLTGLTQFSKLQYFLKVPI